MLQFNHDRASFSLIINKIYRKRVPPGDKYPFIKLRTLSQHQYRSPTEQKPITCKEAIFTRIVIVASVVVFIEAQIYGGVFTFLPLLLKIAGDQKVGLFFMVASGTMIIGRLFIAHFADTYGRGPMFFYSFLIIIASVVVIAKIDSLTMLITAALLYGIGSTICMPALTALIADSSDVRARGRVYSFFYGAFDIGVISAGVPLGFLADLFGLRGMFMVAAGMGLAPALSFMLTIQSQVGHSVRWTLIGK